MIRFVEPGGRMYSTAGTSIANILTNWTLSGTTSGWTISSGNGRFGGSSLRNTTASQGSGTLTKTLDNQSTLGFNFAFKTTTLGGNAIFVFTDAGSTQLQINMTSSGLITLTPNGGTTYTTSKPVIPNLWNYLECKIVFGITGGSIQFKINGETVLNASSIRTIASNSSNQYANTMILGGSGLTNPTDFDDIIFWDGQTTDASGNAAISDFFGDVTLSWLLPTGAGTTTQFTPLTGSNYAQVNEAMPDGDTSYVESATLNNIDSYALADLPANITSVKAVIVASQAKKSDIGGKQMSNLIRTGSTNYAGPAISLPNGYLYSQSSWALNPNTVAAWTVSDVNALEIGQKVAS